MTKTFLTYLSSCCQLLPGNVPLIYSPLSTTKPRDLFFLEECHFRVASRRPRQHITWTRRSTVKALHIHNPRVKEVLTVAADYLQVADLKVYKSCWSSGSDSQLPIRQSDTAAGQHSRPSLIVSGFKHGVIFLFFFNNAPFTSWLQLGFGNVCAQLEEWIWDVRGMREQTDSSQCVWSLVGGPAPVL